MTFTQKTTAIFSTLIFLALSACSGGGGSSGGGSSVTCSDISGGYYGRFTDNCPGYNLSGEMLVSMKSDCSFTGASSYDVTSSGAFTARNGSALGGAGTTSNDGCGKFNINCEHSNGNISCSYTYNSGARGSINARLQ